MNPEAKYNDNFSGVAVSVVWVWACGGGGTFVRKLDQHFRKLMLKTLGERDRDVAKVMMGNYIF